MGDDGKPAPAGLIPTLEQSIENKTILVGSPEEVAEGVQFYRDLLGLQHMTIFPHIIGDPYKKADEQMARFVEDVLPLVELTGARSPGRRGPDARPWVGGRGQGAGRFDRDHVAVTEARVERRGHRHVVAALQQPGAPRPGCVTLEQQRRVDGRRSTCRTRSPDRATRIAGRSPLRRRWRPGSRTSGPRAAARSGAGRRPPSCRTRPPTRRCGSPSPGTTCGAGVDPARARPGWPSIRLNPRPRLCRLMPVVGSTSHEPNPEALDWMRLTAKPSASAVQR